MNVKPFFKEDQEKLSNLVESVYGKKISDLFLNWRFETIFGKPFQYAMWDKNQIVGYYIVHPIPMKIGLNVDKALFSMAVMTHPDYRGKGVFIKLANTIYEKITETNYKFMIGFPNKNSYKIHFEKLGWKNHGNLSIYEKNVDDLSIQNIDESIYTVKTIKKFDREIDTLWNHFKEKYNLIVPRTQEYLNWRFIEQPRLKYTDGPLSAYTFYLIEKNGEPVTYFILKKYGKEKVHLVDHFGLSNVEINKIILLTGINFTKIEKISYFSLWQNSDTSNNFWNDELNKFKFSLKKSDEFFGTKSFESSVNNIVENKSNWYVTMSDNDIY